MASFVLLSTWDLYIFGPSTPYYEKLNDLILRMSETGFIQPKFTNPNKQKTDYDIVPIDESGFHRSLLLFTVIIYLFAALILKGEQVTKKYR